MIENKKVVGRYENFLNRRVNMERNINIRKVKIGDEKVLAYIQTESWKAAFHSILSKEDLNKYTNIDEAEDMYKMLLDNGIGHGYILSVDGTPHCIAYWNKSREEEMKDHAELICIHSLSGNWGKGYGSMMLEYILQEMKDAGFNKAMLWVFEENARARSFYEKYGFILTDKSQMFSDAVEVMYCKEL